MEEVPAVALRRTRDRARAAIIAIGAVCLLRATEFVSLGFQIDLLNRVGSLLPGEAEANDARVNAISVLSVLAWVVAGVLFLRWVRAAHESAHLLDRDERTLISKSTLTWAYFIPFVNFVRPYQHMAILAELSDPRDLELPPLRKRDPAAGYREPAVRVVPRAPWSPPPSFVGVWWGSYVLLVIASRVVQFDHAAGRKIADLVAMTQRAMVFDVLLVATGPLCIAMIRGITACQQERARRLAILARADQDT